MLTAAIIKSLQVYGIAAVISALVAVVIKALVAVTGRLDKKAKAPEIPLGTVCPVGAGVPEEDVAALSAAIFAMIGPHRILHIGQSTHGWAAGARPAQHAHAPAPTHRGHR